MSEPLISVRNLDKVYEPSPPLLRLLLRSSIKEPVQALDDVSLTLERGEIRAVIGPNGAGKSTLFRILTGLTTPTAGTAHVMGMDSTQESTRVRRVVGFAPAEERTLLLRHTCRENLIFHGLMHGMSNRLLKRRINETLELVGLVHAADRVGFALSSGMRARLQLARAMLHRPEVLILDEPTAIVDPVSSYEILGIVKQIVADHRIGVLLSSHRLEEIEALHDKVLVLNQGRVIYDGDLDELRKQWEAPMMAIRLWDVQSASRVVEAIGMVDGAEVASVQGALVLVNTTLGVGELLSHFDSDLPSVASVGETRVSLLDLLVKVLTTDDDRERVP